MSVVANSTGVQQEQREFKRWKVSIPCVVHWGREVAGVLDTLSYGGARVTDMRAAPAEGSKVTLKLQNENGSAPLEITAKVVYVMRSVTETGAWHTFGVDFDEPLARVVQKLTPVFLQLRAQGR